MFFFKYTLSLNALNTAKKIVYNVLKSSKIVYMYTTTNSFNWFDHDLEGGGSIAERTLHVCTGKNMQWMNYIQMTSIY